MYACDTGYTGATCATCSTGYLKIAGACLPCGASCHSNFCLAAGTKSCSGSSTTCTCTCNTNYKGIKCDECDTGYVLNADKTACVKF